MFIKIRRWFYLLVAGVMILGLAACLPDTRSPSAESIEIPTLETSKTRTDQDSAQLTSDLSTSALPSPEINNEETRPLSESVDLTEVPTLTTETIIGESPEEVAREYRVVFVEEDDVLNIRSGPGAEFDIVGEIQPGARGVKVTGQGEEVIDSLWLPIEYKDKSGWVNSRYLTEVVAQEDFCDNEDVAELVDKAYEAFVTQDGDQLSHLVPDGRSLRIRRHWWNPEVNINQDEVANLFESEESYSWGIADGSGNPIEGSFSDVILPLIDRNLEAHSERGCDEILHGGTAGLIELPPSYDGINYYSFFRPAGPDEFEMDWGSWVMGIEFWQGQPYYSFMVHYEWEI